MVRKIENLLLIFAALGIVGATSLFGWINKKPQSVQKIPASTLVTVTPNVPVVIYSSPYKSKPTEAPQAALLRI